MMTRLLALIFVEPITFISMTVSMRASTCFLVWTLTKHLKINYFDRYSIFKWKKCGDLNLGNRSHSGCLQERLVAWGICHNSGLQPVWILDLKGIHSVDLL
jgi:hypothetical protein